MRIEPDFLPYSTPEREGVSSRVLLDLFKAWKELDSLNSFIIVRRGKVIAEHYYAPYRPETPHMLFSLTKSFTSLAIGYAEAEGLLSLDDPAVKFFPKMTFKQDRAVLEKVTIRHLLTMSGGHDTCPLLSLTPEDRDALPDFTQAFFDAPFVYAPGEKFVYNSAGSHVLAAIIRQVTGVNMTEYLTPRLFEPLKIKTFQVMQSPEGVEMGGWGGLARTRDIAKVGECIRLGGMWNGEQIIPAEYLRQATSFQMDNSVNELPDWKVGYGFQFWQSRHGFRGDGACGQYMLVLPEHDLVIAITSGLAEMCRILDPIWDILLPNLYDHARADKPEAWAKLDAFVRDELQIPLCAGDRLRRMEKKTFKMKPNTCGIRSITCSTMMGRAQILWDGPNGEEMISAGFGFFVDNPIRMKTSFMRRAAASAAWVSENVLRVEVVLADSPYRMAYMLDFSNGGLRFERTSNLQFLNPDWPVLYSEV